MAFGRDWIEHFRTLSSVRRRTLDKAVATLMNDSMVQKEMGWLGEMRAYLRMAGK